MGSRRDTRGLQRPAARAGLGTLRAVDDQRGRPDALIKGRGGGAAGQRARGLHARRRIHPGTERGARLLGRGGFLRPRPRRRGRHGPARRGVDRGRDARPRYVGDGLPPLRPSLHEPRLHARPDQRGLLDLLRRQVPRPRAQRRPAAAALADLLTPDGARRRVRREVGMGARQLVRAQRHPRRHVAAPARVGRPPLVTRNRRRACGLSRGRRDLRFHVVRKDRGTGPRRGGVSRGSGRQPRRARRRRADLHADAE